jgi:hypothetical protein
MRSSANAIGVKRLIIVEERRCVPARSSFLWPLFQGKLPAAMETPPEKKMFWMPRFILHATRGVLRDQNTRRKTMFGAVIAAVLLLFAGSTFLDPVLNPHEHPGWFMLFWFACAWITMLAALLAVFDMLLVRRQARIAQQILRARYNKPPVDPSRE